MVQLSLKYQNCCQNNDSIANIINGMASRFFTGLSEWRIKQRNCLQPPCIMGQPQLSFTKRNYHCNRAFIIGINITQIKKSCHKMSFFPLSFVMKLNEKNCRKNIKKQNILKIMLTCELTRFFRQMLNDEHC